MQVFQFNGGRIGVTQGAQSYDLTDALAVNPQAWPPVQMVQFIARFDALMPGLLHDPKTRRIDMALVRLDVPISWPNKVLAFPVNYRTGGLNGGAGSSTELSGFFLKANSSLSGPNDAIVLPDLPGREVHHECELAIVIGKGGRHIARADALSHVFGYACLIDMVVRGKEERAMRKSYDTFCPLGPWITTADAVPDQANLQTRLWVNGELRQDANTRDLLVDIPAMIELCSRVTTLYPGDIIAAGTPAGVGPVQRGDHVRIAIEHLDEMNLIVQ